MDLIKPTIVLGSGGAVATGAYLTKEHWMPTKEKTVRRISDSLQGRRLISSLPEIDLIKQWEAEFESEETSIKKLLGNEQLNKQTGGTKLSKWCSEQMSLDVDKNKEVFKNVEKYCLIRSVESQLKRKQKTLLASNQTNEWKATYGRRKSSTSKREDIGLTGATWDGAQEDADLLKVKEWCSNNSSRDFVAPHEGENSLYTKVLKWCTVEGKDET